MANECWVYEQIQPRSPRAALMVMPCVVYSTLSDTDTLTLNASTTMITVESSVAGTIDFEATDGTAPTGALMPVRLVENIARDFDVRAGTVIRFDAA